ncbi:hypothetical protein C8R32_10225 [Nitrosospira sp. Nsp5]|uniref:Lipoprotein n=1 Tax=Nitrosospira multiformis TaxID=1231 RepID=A0ABY0TR46_9PROT|nr:MULTISPECIES: hypothetical protein [Nitrosospira]PTR09939.1 hypothetical protein C8R32_10225 [Nitrosospira sp. Nsp5]SDR00900.1 hypothetical protein SAMN05216402_3231 [Nitrosospira multiformis]
MKSLILSLLAVTLVGCSAMKVNQTRIQTNDGSKAYVLSSRYGGLDSGTKDMSLNSLNKYATTLCDAGYNVVNEEIIPGPMSPYGTRLTYLTDIIWEIRCKTDPKPIHSNLHGNPRS